MSFIHFWSRYCILNGLCASFIRYPCRIDLGFTRHLFMPVWNHITPPGAKHNTIQYLVINYFHISNRMLKRPLPNSIKIQTYMFRVELRPGQWVVRYHVKCEQANVGITLNVLTQHLDACSGLCHSRQSPHSIIPGSDVRFGFAVLTCMSLEGFRPVAKFSTERFIVFFVGYPSQRFRH